MNAQRFPSRNYFERGVAAVEFAMLAVVLFGFIFGTIELSRVIFVWSTMTEATNRAARAAAMAGFGATGQLRQDALFVSSSSGKLMLGGDIDPSYLRIDYLQADAATPTVPTPTSPQLNAAVCLANPADAACARFVSVRLCLPGTNCSRVRYVPLASLPGIALLNIDMPYFTAIAPVETPGASVPAP
jgi:hypothetical protein